MSSPRRRHIEPSVVGADWWHPLEDGRVQCDLCPRTCRLHEGQQGFCFVRQASEGQLVLTSYGRATGYGVEPIEKKPLNHFFPGSRVLSFGTAGCNLGCRFCPEWDNSKARDERSSSACATPTQVADAALATHCTSIVFAHNDPVIFAEYAIDCAVEARERGLRAVAVSNGYMMPAARRDFYAHIDAVNIDLKAFTERFYHGQCGAHLYPVLDTLEWLHEETDVWLEVTTLVIPGHNDSEQEIGALCDWFVRTLGPDVPLHFTAFHPDFKMLDTPPTPVETLRRARAVGLAAGLHYVYTGNVYDPEGQATACSNCGARVIGRDGYAITGWGLDRPGCCRGCGTRLAGHFAAEPGRWKNRRMPMVFDRRGEA